MKNVEMCGKYSLTTFANFPIIGLRAEIVSNFEPKNCNIYIPTLNCNRKRRALNILHLFIQLKCHKYWPEESEKYGGITVTATRREQYADYVIRTFLLKMVRFSKFAWCMF